MGYLYGSYEINNDVPLGIRARVAAIYEPPQESTRNSIKLTPDERAEEIDELAAKLGLRKVGWIFTDLIADNAASGTVKHIRGIDTHFLTAQECIMAGHLQNQHPNVCKHSSNGYFGSKFVTVCVTGETMRFGRDLVWRLFTNFCIVSCVCVACVGDSSKQVHMEGYAVSGQCMALVRDDCLVPTKDAPELGYIRESSDKQFVPDVYYKVSTVWLTRSFTYIEILPGGFDSADRYRMYFNFPSEIHTKNVGMKTENCFGIVASFLLNTFTSLWTIVIIVCVVKVFIPLLAPYNFTFIFWRIDIQI